MRLQDLADVSAAVTGAKGRLEKTSHLAEALRRMDPEERQIGVAFLSGRLTQGRIGLGWAAISQIRSVAAAAAPALTLFDVDAAFDAIAKVAGSGAVSQRVRLLGDLFERATAAEQEFLFRLLSGELRQGASEGILMDALALAAGVAPAEIRTATMMSGDLGEVARAALGEGGSALARYAVTLFRPIEPMLASPVGSVAEALELLGPASFELKLDGARVQVHKSSSEVRVFSRALREVTKAVPEIVELVSALPSHDLILDGEVLALRGDGSPLPFQETMRRFGRRLDVGVLRKELPLTPFFFDCLYLGGKALTSESYTSRAAALTSAAGALAVPRQVIAAQPDAEAFFQRATLSGHEGLMAKALDSTYAAGTRGGSWLKIKRVRTLDLVVLAAEWGSGRRRGWLSNLHLGARDAERGGFVMLGKTFKGMTDEILEWQTKEFLARETHREGHIVFVRPELVVEIAFNDVQESPQYPGRLALRFARVKGYRPDKSAGDSDTFKAIQEIYEADTGRPAPSRA